MRRESSSEPDAQDLFDGAEATWTTVPVYQDLAHVEQVSDDAKPTISSISSKKGKKRNDDARWNRLRDVQRAFRARRAAHLQVRCLLVFDPHSLRKRLQALKPSENRFCGNRSKMWSYVLVRKICALDFQLS